MRAWRAMVGVLMAAIAIGAACSARAADVTVFAAASLSDALTAIGKSYQQKTGHMVVFSFASSSVLAKQIESSAGAADLFASADTDWMDYLDKSGLIAHASRSNLAGNHLVLIAPADSHIAVKVGPHFDIVAALAGGRLAIADPGSVPAGRYAKASLTYLGVWNAVANHTANAENVRVALAYVARGEAPLGIVYATDALSEPKVRVVDAFPDNSHQPIVYPVALTKDAKTGAQDFLDYLKGPEARAVFQKDGFVVPGGKP